MRRVVDLSCVAIDDDYLYFRVNENGISKEEIMQNGSNFKLEFLLESEKPKDVIVVNGQKYIKYQE